ncbi:MAG: cytochrome b [Rhodobacter sp.]|nr:cytochrome b [Rhodobacter sp.]
MALRNGPGEFGLVTRVIHWAMALLVIAMLALGTRIADLEPGLANLWLYGLHKTLGFLALSLILLRVGWHLYTPPPRPLGAPGPALWAARAAHAAFYLLLIAIPLTGWAGSSATGIDVMIADRWTLPPVAEPSVEGEAFWFGLHGVLTKLLLGLVVVHMLTAIKREMAGDGTLTRMLRGRA